MNPATLTDSAGETVGDLESPVTAVASPSMGSLEQMADVPLTVAFELARCTITAARLLELSPGAVVSLGSVDVDSVTMLVGGERIGNGEITLCGNYLGVRVSGLGDALPEEGH